MVIMKKQKQQEEEPMDETEANGELKEEEGQEIETENGAVHHQNGNSSDDAINFQELKGIKLITAVVKYPQEFCKKICKSFSLSDLPPEEKPSVQIVEEFLKSFKKLEETDEGNSASEQKRIEKFDRKLGGLDFAFSCESDFFKSFLKYGMRHPENTDLGFKLIDMIVQLFSRRISFIKNPTLGIQMMLSHSQAESIFLERVQKPQKHLTNPAIKAESDPPEGATPDGGIPPPVLPEFIPKAKVKEEPEKFTFIKSSLLQLWSTLITSFKEISKDTGTEGDKRILENSVPYLMQMYGATMSPSDCMVFDLLRLYTSPRLDITVETLPLFGPKCFETPKSVSSNPLFAHSTRANTILTCLIDTKAYHTALQFDPTKSASTSASYDLRFLFPLLCHILDEKNICDGGKVISYGWIYFISKGMSVDDLQYRSMAFLAYNRLIQCFQRPKAFRSKDNKIYLHFLSAVRRGIRELGECKISNLLATWLIFAWDVLRQPSNSMFSRVTNSIFVKPIIEMTILPDFVAFYNDGDDNKESRTWILNVLYFGLKTREDWKIAQKSPMIKFMCASFSFEKVKTQRTIISILSRGAEIPEVAEDFVDKYSLLIWLSNVTTTSSALKSDLNKFFENLVTYCPENEKRKLLFEYVRMRVDWINNVKVKVEEPEPEDVEMS